MNDEQTADARVVEAPAGAMPGKRAEILDGPYAGIRFVVEGRCRLGDRVRVRFAPDDQFCRVVS